MGGVTPSTPQSWVRARERKRRERETNRPAVTVLGTLPPIRGLSSYCLELARALADVCTVDFLSFHRIYPSLLYPGGGLREDRSFPPLARELVTVRRALSWYNPMGWLRQGLTSPGDLLHAQWWSLPLAPVVAGVALGYRMRKRPVVLTVHNVRPHEDSAAFDGACRTLCALAHRVIVHTNSGREALVRRHGVPRDKVAVIPHGPLDFHVQRDVDRGAARRDLGLAPQHRVVLLFGAIRPYKGVEVALRAFAQVAHRIPEARLLVAGKAWEPWEPYDRLARDLGVRDRMVLRLGYVPSAEVHRYFEAADLVLLPYERFEAQSGVGATALSFRKPLVVTDVGGLPELVEDPALVVRPGDVEGLSSVLLRCLSSPELLGRMAEHAATAARRMAWPAVAERTREVYRDVLAQGRTGTGARGCQSG